MKILLVMDPGILVPPKGYGGHERLVYMFAKEYNRLGHEVHLFVTKGSFVEGCTVHDFGIEGFPPKKKDARNAIFIAWKFLWKHRNDFDLIHNFGRLAYLIPVLNSPVKKIMTYGREISARNIRWINKLPIKNLVFTGSSDNLVSRGGVAGKWFTVYNAIDFNKYTPQPQVADDAPLIFLGRLERTKGCHVAIKVAKESGNVLVIAGNISKLPEEIIYFEEEIKPHIDGEQVVYVGQVDDERKNYYLGRSKALLFPINASEAFGMVMAEAMACGTPVIGFDIYSVTEVIEEGITGFKVKDENEMKEAIKKIKGIDRILCRKSAQEKFDVPVVAKRYLSLLINDADKGIFDFYGNKSWLLKRICIVTTSQPSVNPRVVKDADILRSAGYLVTVISCFWTEWASETDNVLVQKAGWNFKQVGGTPGNNKLLYYFTRIRVKLNRQLNRLFVNQNLVAERSQARCYDEMLKAAKGIKADWYIGHNLGALPVVVKAAVFHSGKAGFDFEDYHREENDNMPLHEKRIEYLEKKYLPGLSYISTSSDFITEEVGKNFSFTQVPVFTLYNCFSLKQQPAFSEHTDGILKLFWFSQTIGKNRGLELLIEVLNELADSKISLTLAGRPTEDIRLYIQDHGKMVSSNIHFAGIIPPDRLPAYAARFDVGLALEPGFSLNNHIALSNKIFTYMLAGNAMILSATKMQEHFALSNQIGQVFEIGDKKGLKDAILYYKDPGNCMSQRKRNYMLAETRYNWENESKTLLDLIDAA